MTEIKAACQRNSEVGYGEDLTLDFRLDAKKTSDCVQASKQGDAVVAGAEVTVVSVTPVAKPSLNSLSFGRHLWQ